MRKILFIALLSLTTACNQNPKKKAPAGKTMGKFIRWRFFQRLASVQQVRNEFGMDHSRWCNGI